VLELAGVEKIFLAAGAAGSVTFRIQPAAFSFLDRRWQPRTEPGTFDIFVGPDASPASLLKTSVRLLPATA
jgi:hypothetical protein